jgi:hypothetical protein
MPSSTEQSDLKALQAKIALLEQQVVDQQRVISHQKDTIKARESLIINKEGQFQKVMAQLHSLQHMHFGSR